MKKILTIVALSTTMISTSALAAGGQLPPKEMKWQFDGVFGTFDRPSIQRGFQVFNDVCKSCHSLRLLYYRNLQEVGFSEAEVKAIAAEETVIDKIPDDEGDPVERPALPSDRFVLPFANKQAAKAANNGAYPPDLTLITKARMNGPNYLYSLLSGYADAPEGFEIDEGQYFNPYFSLENTISMAPPLTDGIVTYEDGSPETLDQYSKDIVNFLQWTAEPEMEQRKKMGIKVMLFLIVFTGLFIAAKDRVWARVKKDI